jgi:hypothetical protein
MVHKNAGEAIRAFEMAVKDDQTGLLHKYPSDYTLVEIGTWCLESGRIEPYESPKILQNGSDFAQS